jgi:hypothetical protein
MASGEFHDLEINLFKTKSLVLQYGGRQRACFMAKGSLPSCGVAVLGVEGGPVPDRFGYKSAR